MKTKKYTIVTRTRGWEWPEENGAERIPEACLDAELRVGFEAPASWRPGGRRIADKVAETVCVWSAPFGADAWQAFRILDEDGEDITEKFTKIFGR